MLPHVIDLPLAGSSSTIILRLFLIRRKLERALPLLPTEGNSLRRWWWTLTGIKSIPCIVYRYILGTYSQAQCSALFDVSISIIMESSLSIDGVQTIVYGYRFIVPSLSSRMCPEACLLLQRIRHMKIKTNLVDISDGIGLKFRSRYANLEFF